MKEINMFAFFQKKDRIAIPTLDQIKSGTRVLIIDDDEPEELRSLLKKDGWKDFYLEDLDSLENRKLRESQIICIDIMGVGNTLQCENGMGLVKHIKERYPEKKVILYSSVTEQDIFNDALDYVDKRLKKTSSLLPFSKAIEEMAKTTFNWEDASLYAYKKLTREMATLNVDYETFMSITKSSVRSDKSINIAKISKKLGVSLDVASKIGSLLALALTL